MYKIIEAVPKNLLNSKQENTSTVVLPLNALCKVTMDVSNLSS